MAGGSWEGRMSSSVVLLGEYEIHRSMKLKGFGHLTASPGGDPHSQSRETQGRASIFPKLGWTFPFQWCPHWKSQIATSPNTPWPTISQRHFPSLFQSVIPLPSPVIFICIISAWGKIQKIRTLTSSSRGQMKRPFLPRGGVVCSSLEAWHFNYHGIKWKD